MIIILKNIPAKTTKQDVKTFITPAVNGGWFSKRGQIKNISILAQKNSQTHDIQYHSLVEVFPDSIAERVIKKLNRKILSNKFIAVCEYKDRDRDWHNDPRFGKANNLLKNRRIAERRGQYEDISEKVVISSRRVFHMKGW